jgi:hypothetical protein
MPRRDKDLLIFLTSNATWQRYCEVLWKQIFKTLRQWHLGVTKCIVSKATATACAQVNNFASTGPFRELNLFTSYVKKTFSVDII